MRLPSPGTRLLAMAVLFLAPVHVPSPARAFEPSDDLSVYEVDRRDAAKTPQRLTRDSRWNRSPAWSQYVATHPGWVARWNENLGTIEQARGPGLRISGFDGESPRTIERSVRAFLETNAVPSLPGPERLEFLRSISHRNGHWVHFIQKENGIPVYNARLSFRLSNDGRVVSVTNRTWPHIDVTTTPSVSAAEASRAALDGVPGQPRAVAAPELMILPIEKSPGAEYHLAWRTEHRTAEPPGDWISFVDAVTGELLWRFNNVRHLSVSGQVTGFVEPETSDNYFVLYPLPYITLRAVDAGTDTAYATTDTSGDYAFLTGDADPLTLRARLAGPYGRIYNTATGNSTPTLFGTAPGDSSGFAFSFSGFNSLPSERDAFYHAMVAHDYVKTIEPGFSFLDYPMPIWVDEDRTCNAFWDGFGVNFFSEGGGCANTARIATVVEHEYGHGITDFMYRPFTPSGAMHEGFSDYYAATITDQPIIGPGFRGPGTFVRRIDVDKKTPDDLKNEVHADGLIIASALWDMREALGRTTADELWHFARYGYSDNFDDYFADLLDEDDDDGNVYNGTAHFTTLANVFKAHGIGDFSIHVAHAGTPDTEDTLKAFPLTASFLSLFALDEASVQVHLSLNRNGSSSSETHTMTPTGGIREFTWQLDAQPAGSSVAYYFTASDTSGNAVTWPPNGAADPFTFQVGPDSQSPTIAHDPLPDQPADTQSLRVLAVITDNLDKGLSEARLVYRLNGGPDVPLDLNPTRVPAIYSAFLPLPGVPGDQFEYRLEAADSASTPNTGIAPGSGYNLFRLVRGFGRDFEADNGGLSGTFDWAWEQGPSTPDSASGQWGTGFAGHYTDVTLSVLSLPPVNLTGWPSAALTFRHGLDSEESFDGGFVEISIDGGQSWTLLVPDGDYNTFPMGATGSPGWTGHIEKWTPAEFDLSQYLGEADVRLRLRFAADEAITGRGWFIDDIQVVERQVASRPLGLTASKGEDGRVTLAWNLPAGVNDTLNNPVLGYNLYRADLPAGPPALLTAQPVLDRQYVDDTVVNGQHYSYWATAVYPGAESHLAGPVEGFPYLPVLEASLNDVHVTIDSVGTADTTLTVSNTGTGDLRVNVYTALPSQTLSDVRIHLSTGSSAAPDPPAAGAITRAALDAATTVAKTRAPLAGLPESEALDIAAALRRASEDLKISSLPETPLTPPTGIWIPLFVDGSEGSLVDLKQVEAQQTADILYFRLGAYAAWPNPVADFNLALALDTDENQATGYRGGEFVIVAGPVVQAAFGTLGLLFDSTLHPVALLNHLSLVAGETTAEFGVKKSQIGRPAAMNLKVYALNPSASAIIDRAPDVPAFPWLMGLPLFVVASPGQPAAIPMAFSSQGLANGDQDARLILATNDPAHSAFTVPVQLTVTGMVPVVLAGFSAVPGPEGVRLEWQTSEETDHAGFHVYRRETSPEPSAEIRISSEILTAVSEGRYAFLDGGARPGHEYEYRLADISRAGRVSFHGPFPVRVPGTALPTALWLGPAWPNPTRDRTTIRYGVPGAAAVTLRVFSVDGRLVRTLLSEALHEAGYHEMLWDGRDDWGESTGAGIYFYRIEAAGRSESRKLVRVR